MCYKFKTTTQSKACLKIQKTREEMISHVYLIWLSCGKWTSFLVAEVKTLHGEDKYMLLFLIQERFVQFQSMTN